MAYMANGLIDGRNYINDAFRPASWPHNPQKTFAKYNPSTEELMGNFPNTDAKTVRQVVADARIAQKEWKKLSRIKRAEYFDRLIGVMDGFQDAIVNAICKETGKSINEATAEFVEALHMAQYTFGQAREPFGTFVASEIADKDITVFRKPKGVVAVIAPWNFPLAIGGFWTTAPALLEGNTVVFKPSEDSPWTGELIATLYSHACFPPNVFQVVHGDGETGRALVEADVDHICFTGSAGVGKLIRQHCATTWNKSCSCEMGSKSAVAVFADAPSELAVQACVASAFKLSGQRCVSAGRILIESKIYDDFCERFAEACKKITVGDPFEIVGDARHFYGPLINKSQFERVQQYNEMTLGKTNVLLKGERLGDKGYYLTPHVYGCDWEHAHKTQEDWPADMYKPLTHPFLTEEVFGPHVALIPFKDVEDAVRIYNDTEYGLSMGCITTNMSIARYMRDNCDYGLGYHNLPCIGAASHIPFGGVKKSGYGGSSAAGTFKSVTHEVTWTANFDQSGFQMEQGLK